MANFVGGINYGRNYSLEFQPLSTSDVPVKFQQENKLNAKDYMTGLAIEFSVKKTTPPINISSTDTAEITIYNIKPDSSRAIQMPGVFTFSLGHGRDLVEVFKGKATTTASGIVGNDTFLKIPMVAGSYAAKANYFSETYNKGATTVEIGNDLIDFIKGSFDRGLPASDVKGINQFDLSDNVVYDEPVTMRGDPTKLLAQLMPNYFIYVTAMNTVNIVRRNLIKDVGKLLAGPSLLWSPKYGQVDYIKFISSPSSEGEEIVYAGIESRGILTPDINVDTLMNVDASANSQITFGPDLTGIDEKFICRVTSVRHFGNTYTGDFLTEWDGDFVNTNATVDT